MTCWPVSARVGNVKNNDPSLIEPVAAASVDSADRGEVAGLDAGPVVAALQTSAGGGCQRVGPRAHRVFNIQRQRVETRSGLAVRCAVEVQRGMTPAGHSAQGPTTLA